RNRHRGAAHRERVGQRRRRRARIGERLRLAAAGRAASRRWHERTGPRRELTECARLPETPGVGAGALREELEIPEIRRQRVDAARGCGLREEELEDRRRVLAGEESVRRGRPDSTGRVPHAQLADAGKEGLVLRARAEAIAPERDERV